MYRLGAFLLLLAVAITGSVAFPATKAKGGVDQLKLKDISYNIVNTVNKEELDNVEYAALDSSLEDIFEDTVAEIKTFPLRLKRGAGKKRHKKHKDVVYKHHKAIFYKYESTKYEQ